MRVRLSSFLLSTLSLFLLSISAKANSFPITGVSDTNPTEFGNVVTGGSLSLSTSSPSGPFIIDTAVPGTFVQFQLQVPICSVLQGCPVGTSSVTFGGQSTGLMNGGFIFSGSFTAPVGTNTEVTITFPVSMIGNVVAFQDMGDGVAGPEMFALSFKGTGTMTLTICAGCDFNGIDDINTAFVSFSGTATTVPEPSSLLLLGSGLAGIARLRRTQRHQNPRLSDGA